MHLPHDEWMRRAEALLPGFYCPSRTTETFTEHRAVLSQRFAEREDLISVHAVHPKSAWAPEAARGTLLLR